MWKASAICVVCTHWVGAIRWRHIKQRKKPKEIPTTFLFYFSTYLRVSLSRHVVVFVNHVQSSSGEVNNDPGIQSRTSFLSVFHIWNEGIFFRGVQPLLLARKTQRPHLTRITSTSTGKRTVKAKQHRAHAIRRNSKTNENCTKLIRLHAIFWIWSFRFASRKPS